MEKKNGLLTAALLATVLFMGGCSSEDSEMGTPAQPGSPILFSVADVQPRTRTIYEDRLQINWVENDEIGICSPSDNVLPSVEGESKNATYKVTALNADGHLHHAEIEASVQGICLKWGDDLNTPAVFYGAYPAERIVTYPEENSAIFSMKFYTNQECEVYSSENGVYLTKPDMKNAYMVAKNELTPIGDHVLLSFDPIMTTPDITITAGSYEVGTGIIQPVTVTGVSVIMPKKLSSSDLNYKITDLTNGNITAPRGELQDITDGQESVFIQIDNAGKKYIDLYEGESINLMAFLPPIPNLTNAQIRVHTLGATDFVKTVTDELKAQSRITIKLPDITPETTKPNNWISRLDGNTSLKSMSIPAYVCKGTETSDDIKKLLKKGVRAFDAQELTSSSFGKHTINKDFVNVCNEYLKGYTTEFIIVWTENNIKDTSWEMFTNEINQARGKVILIQKHNKGLFTSDKFTNNGESDKLFGFNTVVEKFDLTNSDWNAMLNNEVANNKILYDKIVTSTKQSGCTGIVTIPNADKFFDSSYGDLLLQAVIDCNFKLRRNSKNQQ